MADDKKNIPDAEKVDEPPKLGKVEPAEDDPRGQDQPAPAKTEAPEVEGAPKAATPPTIQQTGQGGHGNAVPVSGGGARSPAHPAPPGDPAPPGCTAVVRHRDAHSVPQLVSGPHRAGGRHLFCFGGPGRPVLGSDCGPQGPGLVLRLLGRSDRCGAICPQGAAGQGWRAVRRQYRGAVALKVSPGPSSPG